MLTQSQRAELAARLRRGDRAGAATRITRRDPGITRPPASFAQEQVWFVDQFAPGQAAYNIPCVISLDGQADLAAVNRALGRLIERHETLRTRLVAASDGVQGSGHPVQVIDEPAKPDLTVVDLPEMSLRDYVHSELMQPFDLAAEPLLRTRLVRLSPTRHMLIAIVHHTIFDGWSAGVFLRDLAALYASEVTGEPSGLAELPVQFADYAVWERDRLRDGTLAELQDYWRQRMDGFETLQFPADHPRPAVEDFAGGVVERTISTAVLDGLQELSSREGATMFTTFAAGILALLHRYTGQTDLVVGTVSANRSRSVLAPVIGFLVNTLPVRCDVSGDPAFTQLLASVKQATVGAFAHQDLPFSKIVDTLKVARDPSRTPIFQTLLTYAKAEDLTALAADVEFTALDVAGMLDAAKFDLAFAAAGRADGLRVECTYKTSLFERATIDRLLGHLETLLEGIVANPAARLSQLPVLTSAELHDELTTWNDTAGPAPGGCAHHRFEAQAAATPHAIAARFEDQALTYAELNRRADRIAATLRAHSTGPESLVGVCMRTSLTRLAAFLGIWKAGGGYVPLDPDLPTDRLTFMINDTSMHVIITDNDAASAVPDLPEVRVINTDHEPDVVPESTPATTATPGNAAYVIYTSGSTGQPKGVVVEHHSLVNLTQAMASRWGIGPGSRMLQFASFTFDVSVMDMFTPLLSGATLILATRDTLLTPHRLAQLVRDERVTFAGLPPAVFNLLPEGDYPHLRHIMAAGEELPAELARRWTQPGGPRLINGYGPTETTIIATQAEIDASTPMPPPIGYPVHPNYRAYVLDAHLQPVPVGVTGELHIGGAGVARGYLNRPELTAERFITDPAGQRLYKTGDLVKRRPDGSIVYLGRIDNQVKINGIRIELGEIEAALTGHPAIAQAIAHVIDGELAAYLRTNGSAVSEAAIRDHLSRALPSTMIPAHLVVVDDFPLNASGKVDKKALPAPSRPEPTGQDAAATPTEELLIGLFATLLGAERPGVTDGFFELGGNSLNAMRLVDMISRETGVDVAVTQVFLHPTARRLAELIDTLRDGGEKAGPVVRMTPAAGGPSLFLVHAIGGTVSAYTPLSQELADTFTVYGMEAPATLAGSLEDLVSDYVRRLRSMQPDGPYHLAGWSMGGVIAFEMARLLERAGAEVGSLTLLDAPFVARGDWGIASEGELARRFVADAALTAGLDIAAAPDAASADAQLDWLAARLSADGNLLRRRFDVFAAHSHMMAAYEPVGPAISAPTLIVSALGSPNAPAREHWPRLLSGPVHIACFDSDHYAFLRTPLVTRLGDLLKEDQGC